MKKTATLSRFEEQGITLDLDERLLKLDPTFLYNEIEKLKKVQKRK